MTKQIKQVATTEDYIVARYEDDSIGVYNRYGNTKGALREIAEVQGFEYDPTWTTRQFGKKLIDAVDNGAPAIANDHYIVYIDTNGTVICGRKTEGSAKGTLRMIAEKYSIIYEEGWNTQQFGRKVIEHLLNAKTSTATKEEFLEKIRKDIKEFLSKNSNLFFNERDFQVNLSSFLKEQHYYDNVFLEYSLPASFIKNNEENEEEVEEKIIEDEANVRIDIVVEKSDQFCPIELKYKTKLAEKEDAIKRFGKKIKVELLKNQAAQNINRYSFWKDVYRVERIKRSFHPNVIAGFSIFMTNDESYMNTPKGASEPFTMEAGVQHSKELEWEEKAKVADSTKSKYPKIELEKEYTIGKWYDVTIERIVFHYCIVEV
jgi:hypothetical protein